MSADVPAVASLRAQRRGTLEEARRWAEGGVERNERNAGSRLLVAESAAEGRAVGRVVGYGVVGRFDPPPDRPDAGPAGHYLLGVMVDPAHRRQGYGAALVASRLDWIRLRAREAFYFADDDNAPTIALHARFGFQPLTRTFWFPGLQSPDTPMTLYRLELA